MTMKPFWFTAGPRGNAGVLVRLGAIGAVMLGVAGAFAYAGG
jgi:catalase